MVCTRCKKEFSDEYKSCPHCGNRVHRLCDEELEEANRAAAEVVCNTEARSVLKTGVCSLLLGVISAIVGFVAGPLGKALPKPLNEYFVYGAILTAIPGLILCVQTKRRALGIMLIAKGGGFAYPRKSVIDHRLSKNAFFWAMAGLVFAVGTLISTPVYSF